MGYAMKQIVRALIFAAICFLFVLMVQQAWAECEPQVKTQCESVQLDRRKEDLESGDFRNANLTGARMNEATWLNWKVCKAPSIGSCN